MVTADASGRVYNLLMVEDSDTQAIAIRRLLQAHGFRVERAAKAEAALDHLNVSLPDLIIADFHLPGMSGGELSRRLRLNSRTRSIPLLMLTDVTEVEAEREGLESGADAYISKSADPDFLILRIRALLRERPAAVAAGDDMPHFRRLRFLVLDDDPAAIAEHRATLLSEGYLVDTAPDVGATVARLRDAALPIDCVLMGLPPRRFDSVEACLALNAHRAEEREQRGERSTAPFLLIGIERDGAVLKDKLALAFDAGLDEFIPTLRDHGLLLVRLRAIARRKMMQDEMAQADADRREHAITVERARMTEALTQANAELGAANDKLIEAQAKLVQAAKMASLGEFVAGIAHEINNPLAFILAHQATVQRLLNQISPQDVTSEKARGHIAKAQDRAIAMGAGLNRIRDLVLNLRQFSRLDEGGFLLVDVFEAIDTVLTLLRPKLDERISVGRRYDAPRMLWCSPALLNQVVMNIVSNAADAIEGEGRIDITVTVEAADYVIRVDDSGPGVPDAVRARIFEPFFTTKPIGSGTGLGLAIAYSVVKAHQGAITIGRSPCGGASFKIAVPLAEEMGRPASPAAALAGTAPPRQPIPGE